MVTISVTLTKSGIGQPGTQKKTLLALGLRKLNQTVVLNDSKGLRGQLAKVHHLVSWQVNN